MTTVINQLAEPALDVASPLIAMRGVEKVYRTGKLEFTPLRSVDLSIWPGEMVAVVGPPGSGKTTILNMITGIDRPTAGTVVVDGADLGALDEEALARWRGATVGIVFQPLVMKLLGEWNWYVPGRAARPPRVAGFPRGQAQLDITSTQSL
jgi:predicted ABC-type transport system involved in lysophospholipase L1 biosynthesis ATPase subunit